MEQYIKKTALVAEIERLAEVKPIDEFQPQVQNKIDWLSGKLFAINSLRVFLDTLEVKEVNEVPATVMVNKYGNRFISSWSGLKEYDDLKEGQEIKILIPQK